MKNILLRCLIMAGGLMLARIVPEGVGITDWEPYVMVIYLGIILDMDVSNYGKPTKPHQK